MKASILIPARMASSRLPGKPLADILGKPMILHVWERALAAQTGPVAVATDDASIKHVIEEAGGIAIMTDPNLPSGTDRIHAALSSLSGAFAESEAIINLQGDLPFIPPSHIQTALSALADGADIGTLACPIKHEASFTNPNIVKVVFAGDTAPGGRALYFSRAPIPTHGAPSQHSAPQQASGGHYGWEHVGIYAYRKAALERFIHLPPSPLEQREKLEQLRALEKNMHIEVRTIDHSPLAVDTIDDLRRANQQRTPL